VPGQTVTDSLAAFAASLQIESMPPDVVDRTRRIVLDTIASAFAGNAGDEVEQIDHLARSIGGEAGESTVIGRGLASPAGAALMNGYLITAATVCDVHRPTLCHVTPEVVPPALVVAEQAGCSGRDLLTAIAAGLEVTTRVGLGTVYPTFRERGWHSPGVTGPFGGAASAGRLLDLDVLGMRNAFGLAGSQSAGTFAHWGTPTIKFHQSRGALSGLMAAWLAQTGFEASPDILTAPDGGLLGTYAGGGDPAAVTDGLGEHWELMNISLRRWPVASSIQSMVTALFEILEERPVDVADIASIRIGLSDTVYRMHGELGWDVRFRALLSTRYVASVIAHDRRCWLEQFTPARIADAEVGRFARDRVHVEVADVPTNAATVELRTGSGAVYSRRRDAPTGDATDPLSWADIEGKLRDAAGEALPSDSLARIIGDVRELDGVADVRPLLALLRSPSSRPSVV
jgi:2-methylcitrate dehydratase PrpD